MRVYQKGEAVLSRRCEEFFETLTPETLEELRKTMEENRGIGLAANQVGISRRFFVAKIGGKFGAFINPVIMNHGKAEEEEPEGCLSILDENGEFIFKPKKRWSVIDVIYWDEQKRLFKKTLKRLDARIFQHEVDHLDGRLCQ